MSFGNKEESDVILGLVDEASLLKTHGIEQIENMNP